MSPDSEQTNEMQKRAYKPPAVRASQEGQASEQRYEMPGYRLLGVIFSKLFCTLILTENAKKHGQILHVRIYKQFTLSVFKKSCFKNLPLVHHKFFQVK